MVIRPENLRKTLSAIKKNSAGVAKGNFLNNSTLDKSNFVAMAMRDFTQTRLRQQRERHLKIYLRNTSSIIQSHYAFKMRFNNSGTKLEPALQRQEDNIEHLSSYAHVNHTTAKQVILSRRKNENVSEMKNEKVHMQSVQN